MIKRSHLHADVDGADSRSRQAVMHSIDSHRPLILVVDDAPDSIEPIVNCLHKADFRTRIATGANAPCSWPPARRCPT